MNVTKMMQMMTRMAIHPLKTVAIVGAAMLVLGLVLAYSANPAHAATTYRVDRIDDPDLSTTPTADDCSSSMGNDCSLRGAITAANANAGDDTIDIRQMGTVQLTQKLPDLESNMTINGLGADNSTVNGGGPDSDFRIFTVDDGSVVSISGITISGGNVVGGLDGGGILNEGTLTLTDSTVSDNTTSQTGGGIRNFDGLTVVEHSTITNNTALRSRQGSGLYSNGDSSTFTEVFSSIVSGNPYSDVAGSAGGGFNPFVSKGYNVIGNGDATGAFKQRLQDQVGITDPKLGALADNGGPTRTHAPLMGSRAIDTGNPTTLSCPYTVKCRFVGAFSPIPLSTYKVGSTIPVKFALTDASGTKLSDAVARSLVASPCKVKVSLGSGTKNCVAYNATTDTFQYNLKVPKNLPAGSYKIFIEVSAPDGTGVVNRESIGVYIRR